MEKISVLTATYNRANLLQNVYRSLCNQDTINFVWIIVDDGSSDNTRELVDEWIKEDKVKINYVYQRNLGVSRARCTGTLYADTKWIITLDSDDYLLDGALKKISDILYQKKDILAEKKCAGLMFPMKTLKTRGLQEGKHTLTEQYYKHGATGEMQLVIKTELYKRFQAPHFMGEKFVTESAVLRKIDCFYYYYCMNQSFLVREYKADGLTENLNQVVSNYPYGQAYAMKVDCVYGKQMGFFKRVQAYTDFMNFTYHRFGETEELFPELHVPVEIKICSKIAYNNNGFLQYLRCKMTYPFPKKTITKGSRIILWGAGNMGQANYFTLQKEHYCELVLWVDTCYGVKQTLGLPVSKPEQIFETLDYDYIVIAIKSWKEANDIKKYLIEQGIIANKIVLEANGN